MWGEEQLLRDYQHPTWSSKLESPLASNCVVLENINTHPKDGHLNFHGVWGVKGGEGWSYSGYFSQKQFIGLLGFADILS